MWTSLQHTYKISELSFFCVQLEVCVLFLSGHDFGVCACLSKVCPCCARVGWSCLVTLCWCLDATCLPHCKMCLQSTGKIQHLQWGRHSYREKLLQWHLCSEVLVALSWLWCLKHSALQKLQQRHVKSSTVYTAYPTSPVWMRQHIHILWHVHICLSSLLAEVCCILMKLTRQEQ